MADDADITYPDILPANDLSDSVGDNSVHTFQLESNAFRGRSVRLGSVLDEILSAHEYPDEIAYLVAETLTLTVLLSSMLKFEGIFTLQAKGEGAVNMLVADMASEGGLRACATFDKDALQEVTAKRGDADFLSSILGKGYIAFTVDQKLGERYQGIVELKGSSLVECAQHYFEQSEQIKTGIVLAADRIDGAWRSGGIMLQEIPDEGGVDAASSADDEDEWQRAMAFLESASDAEILSSDISANDLLHRLYHEEGVRVFEPLALRQECRCDEERVKNVLSNMSDEDMEEMSRDGMISMRCEFCSYDYEFDAKTLEPVVRDE